MARNTRFLYWLWGRRNRNLCAQLWKEKSRPIPFQNGETALVKEQYEAIGKNGWCVAAAPAGGSSPSARGIIGRAWLRSGYAYLGMDKLWGKIDLERWQETPCLRGRVAVEQDVKDGRAVFYIQDAEELGVVFVDIGLPRCAIFSEDSREIPVVIIQSERLGEKHTIGYRSLDCGNGICTIAEVELLERPDERSPAQRQVQGGARKAISYQ